MKQKKFKIKSNTLVKFKRANSLTGKWRSDTELTTSSITTTSNTTGIFNR